MHKTCIFLLTLTMIAINSTSSNARGLGTICALGGSHIVNGYIWRVGLLMDKEGNWPSAHIDVHNSDSEKKYYLTTGVYGRNDSFFETLYSLLNENRLEPELLSICIAKEDNNRFIGVTQNY